MVSISAIVFLFQALFSCGSVADIQAKLTSVLVPKLKTFAAQYNTSYTVAVNRHDFDEPWVFTAGIDDHNLGTDMKIDRLIPQGSITKPFTVATALKLAEQGVWHMDDPAYLYIDPFLKKHNGTTLLELWKDARINDVTLRHLAGMRSGIYDYNDTELQNFFLANPSFDVSPFDLIHNVNKSFWFDPGQGGAYTTTGINLLGLALATAFKIDKWEDLNQTWIWPHHYSGIYFSKPGPCTQNSHMAHQYMLNTSDLQYHDIINGSCLNSWAGGNIAATAQDLSRWWLDLFEGAVLKPESFREMTTFHANTAYFQVGGYYGLGLEVLDWYGKKNRSMSDPNLLIGHGGGDYGSSGYGGYQRDYNFSFHYQSNTYTGMNLTLTSKENSKSKGLVRCTLYNDVLAIMSNGVATKMPCALEEPIFTAIIV